MIKRLTFHDTYKQCDPDIFQAEDTSSIKKLNDIVGQTRVYDALDLAIRMDQPGYNVFALGEGGIGKNRLIRNFLNQKSHSNHVTHDYCYVYNFEKPDLPMYLEFTPGDGIKFKAEFDRFIDDLKVSIPNALENISYDTLLENKENTASLKYQQELEQINQLANQHNIGIVKGQGAAVIVPIHATTKKPLTREEISGLTEQEVQALEKEMLFVQEKLTTLLSKLGDIETEKQQKIKERNANVVNQLVTNKILKLKNKWGNSGKVSNYLNQVITNIPVHLSYFYKNTKIQETSQLDQLVGLGQSNSNQYIFDVNLFVCQPRLKNKAPVIILNDPTYSQLFGKIDYTVHLGQFLTNFTLIKPGALHEANGGYLVINARPLLETPLLWYQLKKIIKSRSLPFSLDNNSGINVVTLNPEPIPFYGKIILIGEPMIYNALWHYDPEFKELFKITAEFNGRMAFNKKNSLVYGGVVASIVDKEKLLHFDKYALSKLVEVGARAIDSQNHLTTNISYLIDVIREANIFAQKAKRKLVSKEDVTSAINFRKQLRSHIPNFIQDRIKDKTILIQTKGYEVGQINGLSVMQINEFSFGQPQRISCVVFKGKKELIDIESNVKLAGSIYAKGVMIASAFLHSQFSKKKLLSFSASLNFEQSYGMIDGDSASAASIFAIISALANIPIKQSFAVTGSVDQKGRIQAIGGVNEKIEGFFDICNQRGLDGSHAVIIPQSNAKDLMLKDEVVAAIQDNKFQIYTIDHIIDGLELILYNKKLKQINFTDIKKIIERTWLN